MCCMGFTNTDLTICVQLPQPVRSRKDSDPATRGGGGGVGIQFTLDKKVIGGQWAVESSEDEDEEEKQDQGRRSWKDEKRVGLHLFVQTNYDTHSTKKIWSKEGLHGF